MSVEDVVNGSVSSTIAVHRVMATVLTEWAGKTPLINPISTQM